MDRSETTTEGASTTAPPIRAEEPFDNIMSLFGPTSTSSPNPVEPLDCSQSVCLRIFIQGVVFGLSIVGLFFTLACVICLWLALRRCCGRTNHRTRPVATRPIIKAPTANPFLSSSENNTDEGRPITPPRRRWPLSRYLRRWADPSLSLQGQAMRITGEALQVIT